MEGIVLGDPNGGYFEIWRTTNGGNTWTRVPSANMPSPASNIEYGQSHVLAVRGNALWFGTTAGRIFRSTDKGLTWKRVATHTIIYMYDKLPSPKKMRAECCKFSVI